MKLRLISLTIKARQTKTKCHLIKDIWHRNVYNTKKMENAAKSTNRGQLNKYTMVQKNINTTYPLQFKCWFHPC